MEGLETALAQCPYCGEEIELLIDRSVPEQEYIEDCPVCCQPIEIAVEVEPRTPAAVIARRDDEA